jgi:predicted dehydrogenase
VSDQIKLGIIGLHNHYHIYPMADYLAKGLPGLALVSVYDERTTLAREFAGNYQVPEVHESRQSLLERHHYQRYRESLRRPASQCK